MELGLIVAAIIVGVVAIVAYVLYEKKHPKSGGPGCAGHRCYGCGRCLIGEFDKPKPSQNS